MTGHYTIAGDVAWVDASEGGRDEPIAWVARVPHGPAYELRGPAWLVWMALTAADGASPAELPQRIASLGGPHGVPTRDLERFLDDLVDRDLCLVAQ